MKNIFLVLLISVTGCMSMTSEANNDSALQLPVAFNGLGNLYRNGDLIANTTDTVKFKITRLDSILVGVQYGGVGTVQDTNFLVLYPIDKPKNTIFINNFHDDTISFNADKSTLTQRVSKDGVDVYITTAHR